MTKKVRYLFARFGLAPREKRGHIPRVVIRGTTCRVSCSCGRDLGGGRGCNRAGMDYCISWGLESHARHIGGDS